MVDLGSSRLAILSARSLAMRSCAFFAFFLCWLLPPSDTHTSAQYMPSLAAGRLYSLSKVLRYMVPSTGLGIKQLSSEES